MNYFIVYLHYGPFRPKARQVYIYTSSVPEKTHRFLQNTKKIDLKLCGYSQIQNSMSENTISEEKSVNHLFQPMLNVVSIFIYG